MGVRVHWDNDDKTILRYYFDTTFTWDDFYLAKTEAYNMIDTVQQKVGVIFDTPPDIRLPPSMITHARSAIGTKHANTLIVVVVVRSLYLRTMFNMLTKVSPAAARSIQLAANVDEARTIIAERLKAVTPAAIPT